MTIQEIKTQLPITQVLNHYGLEADKNNRLKCPWHNDKTPSLQIYPKTGTWTCFSTACSAGSGDQIEMIQKLEGCNKHEAILKAKERVKPMAHSLLEAQPTQAAKLNPITEQIRIAILGKFYQKSLQSLPRSKQAQAYAESRGLKPDKLGIGYSGNDLGRRWNKNLQDSALKMGLLKKSGNNIGPKLKYCLLFVMKNRDGQIVDMYGRSVIADNKGNKNRHFYLSGVQQGLYPRYPKPETRKLILTESIIDAASLATETIMKDYEILALYGTNGMTKEHTEAISSLESLQEVIFFFDGDNAGDDAVSKWSKEIRKLKPNSKVSVVETPRGEDVNSLLCGHEDGNVLLHLIEQRKEYQESETQSQLSFSTESSRVDRRIEHNGRIENNCKAGLPALDTSNAELPNYTTEELRITILGGIKITGLDRLKVTLKVELRNAHKLPVRYALDLYYAKQVENLCEMISDQLEIRNAKAHRIVNGMTSALENYRQSKLETMKPSQPKIYKPTEKEKREAVNYLKDPNLMANTARDLKISGIVGEESNALIGYTIYLSRKREKPLHVMYLGASGMGKTHLQESLANLIPQEDKEEATGMSPQSLYYEKTNLKHKVLFIEDVDGAQDVMYVIRELQTKNKIVKRVAYRDNKGNTKTIKITAEGPVVISSCTTKEKIYEDNANRCILLYIDSSKEQDERIMESQKAASAGYTNKVEQKSVIKRLQNVQRLLRAVRVINPYATYINIPQRVFKPRRSLKLLLSFIETVTFYHQYQRRLCTRGNNADGSFEQHIETTYEDIEISFRLMKDVLFNKSDELTKASREFLEMLKEVIPKGDTFTRSELRKELRMNINNLKRYIRELVANDYLKVKRGNRYKGYEYEITDYAEYNVLKSEVETRLNEILLTIKALSGSVGHSGSNGVLTHSNSTASAN